MYIHKEGKWYVIIASISFIILSYLLIQVPSSFLPISYFLIFVLFLFTFWVFWFFRIPSRQINQNPLAVLSPCDGKVVVIEETFEPEYFNDKRLQISIFMSPLNVHVNRYPINGKVVYTKYHKGKFLVAWHPKSSTENERSTVVVKNENGKEILIRQIAGAVARRIITYAEVNDTAKQNEEFGFIKFGSRVDLFLPIGTTVNVKIDDLVQGQLSEIAEF
jgi:phosphatidylserine decarboxylase